VASALWFVPGGEVENLNLVTQENREASMLVTTLEAAYIESRTQHLYPYLPCLNQKGLFVILRYIKECFSNLNLVTQENREASMLVTTLEDGSVVYLAQESTLQ